jgi:hypothetical protein
MSLTVKTVLLITIMMAGMWSNDARAEGQSPEITGFGRCGGIDCVVNGNTYGPKLWLGFSFTCGGGAWQDREPERVKGSFSESFTLRICPSMDVVVRTCLWRGRDRKTGLMEGRITCEEERI